MALLWSGSDPTCLRKLYRLGYMISDLPLFLFLPWGLIVAPLVSYLYLLPLGFTFRKHKIVFRCYEDVLQVYVPLTQKYAYSMKTLALRN